MTDGSTADLTVRLASPAPKYSWDKSTYVDVGLYYKTFFEAINTLVLKENMSVIASLFYASLIFV
jgi:hypothetical protein